MAVVAKSPFPLDSAIAEPPNLDLGTERAVCRKQWAPHNQISIPITLARHAEEHSSPCGSAGTTGAHGRTKQAGDGDGLKPTGDGTLLSREEMKQAKDGTILSEEERQRDITGQGRYVIDRRRGETGQGRCVIIRSCGDEQCFDCYVSKGNREDGIGCKTNARNWRLLGGGLSISFKIVLLVNLGTQSSPIIRLQHANCRLGITNGGRVTRAAAPNSLSTPKGAPAPAMGGWLSWTIHAVKQVMKLPGPYIGHIPPCRTPLQDRCINKHQNTHTPRNGAGVCYSSYHGDSRLVQDIDLFCLEEMKKKQSKNNLVFFCEGAGRPARAPLSCMPPLRASLMDISALSDGLCQIPISDRGSDRPSRSDAPLLLVNLAACTRALRRTKVCNIAQYFVLALTARSVISFTPWKRNRDMWYKRTASTRYPTHQGAWIALRRPIRNSIPGPGCREKGELREVNAMRAPPRPSQPAPGISRPRQLMRIYSPTCTFLQDEGFKTPEPAPS
ncbi:Nucleolar protein 4 [Branchiostoma belcheri]|nr:Nucleolar protein 4 [Branchiostoma belcheri]